MADHTLTLTTAELDAIVKSVMKSISANTDKLRRLKDGSQQNRTARADGAALASALSKAMAAQAES
jgi:hypothetical protein